MSVVPDSVQPHWRKPTRLPSPWDSPGKNTGVGCQFLRQCMKVKSESEAAQSCPTLSDPMDCSLPGSSSHEIFQARVLEWGTIDFSTQTHYVIWNKPDTKKYIAICFHLMKSKDRQNWSMVIKQQWRGDMGEISPLMETSYILICMIFICLYSSVKIYGPIYP